jgi:hypothetical protein
VDRPIHCDEKSAVSRTLPILEEQKHCSAAR